MRWITLASHYWTKSFAWKHENEAKVFQRIVIQIWRHGRDMQQKITSTCKPFALIYWAFFKTNRILDTQNILQQKKQSISRNINIPSLDTRRLQSPQKTNHTEIKRSSFKKRYNTHPYNAT